jgi:hypothetical protein
MCTVVGNQGILCPPWRGWQDKVALGVCGENLATMLDLEQPRLVLDEGIKDTRY